VSVFFKIKANLFAKAALCTIAVTSAECGPDNEQVREREGEGRGKEFG
jgi:hypothetical protein